MIYIKKYNTIAGHFVLLLAFAGLLSCSSPRLYNNKIEGRQIPVNNTYTGTQEIENFIVPYRTHIDKDLDSVLAYNPETLDKSKSIEKWQTAIGNLMADVTMEYADKVFYARHKKHVDVCLLNHGGIRAIIPQGNVTARTAYEIMPFENSLVIIALKGEQLREMADYFVREKKPHPLAGMAMVLNKEGNVMSITIMGVPVTDQRVYYVATSDYLSNGGDKMDFFKRGTATYDMDYKLRNIFIDYFKDTDTIKAATNIRISTQ
jgi:2',3'-cyclic-nucleotide 2'-phosphodiesterase (5'-nucleotidase family)